MSSARQRWLIAVVVTWAVAEIYLALGQQRYIPGPLGFRWFRLMGTYTGYLPPTPFRVLGRIALVPVPSILVAVWWKRNRLLAIALWATSLALLGVAVVVGLIDLH